MSSSGGAWLSSVCTNETGFNPWPYEPLWPGKGFFKTNLRMAVPSKHNCAKVRTLWYLLAPTLIRHCFVQQTAGAARMGCPHHSSVFKHQRNGPEPVSRFTTIRLHSSDGCIHTCTIYSISHFKSGLKVLQGWNFWNCQQVLLNQLMWKSPTYYLHLPYRSTFILQ